MTAFATAIATAARQGYTGTGARKFHGGQNAATRTYAPSAKQAAFILTLVTERAELYTQLGQASAAKKIQEFMATFDVSSVTNVRVTIDRLLSTNKDLKIQLKAQQLAARITTDPAVEEAAAQPVTMGMYHFDGKNYRVRESKAGHLYAEEAVNTDQGDGTYKTSFVYARGIVTKLTGDHRMTPEQAKAHGAYFGTCICCGRTLTREDSIERMVGPICWEKNFG